MDSESIQEFIEEQSAAIQASKRNVTEWQKDLKKAVRSWRESVLWRINAQKYRVAEEVAALKGQEQEVDHDGTADTVGESRDDSDLLEFPDRDGDEAKADDDSGRKRRNKHEGAN